MSGEAARTDLDALRRKLDGLADLPLQAHPDVFEDVHAGLAAELSRLEEV